MGAMNRGGFEDEDEDEARFMERAHVKVDAQWGP